MEKTKKISFNWKYTVSVWYREFLGQRGRGLVPQATCFTVGRFRLTLEHLGKGSTLTKQCVDSN